MNEKPDQQDPFREHRKTSPLLDCMFQGESVPMILRHDEVRKAAKDWQTFSSDAPFRIPIPSEEDLRTVRQLPIETDPPLHTEYRRIVEPFFKRPKQPEFIAQIDSLITGLLDHILACESIEIVHELAIPLQSRALAYLLGVSQSEADIWISWGIHVFKDVAPEEVKGVALEEYIKEQLERATTNAGEDFFSALTTASFQGRPLTREEMVGFANLAFAGGRDTVIHTISSVVAYLAGHPEVLVYLHEDPTRVVLAGEEFLRVLSPLTHIGRVCPAETSIQGQHVQAGGRASLCWASANRDETVFDDPDTIRLDRKPNPHLAFGSGPHICLGALHARLILRLLLKNLSQRVKSITILSAEEHLENEERYQRQVGYDSLTVEFTPA